jgi:hypothetical protein
MFAYNHVIIAFRIRQLPYRMTYSFLPTVINGLQIARSIADA